MGFPLASAMVRVSVGSLVLWLAFGVAAGDGPEKLAASALASIKAGLHNYDMAAVEEALVDLDEVYDKLSPKTVKAVRKAVASVFKTRPRAPREEGEDTRDELVDSYQLAIGLIFEREQGDKLLQTALKAKHLKDWPSMRARLVEGLGYRKDPGLIPFLGKLLDDDAGLVAGAAATALGQLSEEPQPVRRAAVAKLLGAWTEADQQARKEVDRRKQTSVARDRLAQIEGPVELALRRLTRQRHDGPEAWEEWFTKHGSGSDW